MTTVTTNLLSKAVLRHHPPAWDGKLGIVPACPTLWHSNDKPLWQLGLAYI